MIFVLIYVDEIIVTSSSDHAIQALLHDLKNDFSMKDLGELNYFLGIEVKKIRKGLLLTQENYVTELLAKISMTKCTSSPTPLSSTEKLSIVDGSPFGPEDSTI
jgi:hypothetical protein